MVHVKDNGGKMDQQDLTEEKAILCRTGKQKKHRGMKDQQDLTEGKAILCNAGKQKKHRGRKDTPALTKRKEIGGGSMAGSALTKGKEIVTDNRVHDSAVLTARFNANGDFFFTAGQDGLISFWKSSDGELFQDIKDTCDIRDICITKDDKTVVSCASDGQIFLYDLQTARCIRTFSGHSEGVNAISVNEFGSVLVTADTCVRLWDLRSQSRQPMQVFDTFGKNDVTSLCLKRTGIIAGSLDGTVHSFDLRQRTRLLHKIGAPLRGIYMEKKDEDCIIASCLDSTFRLLRVEAHCIETDGKYKGHTWKSSKLGCCFTNEATYIIGGSEDGRIFLWDLSGDVVLSFNAHSSAVTSLDYHPTKDCMISAAMDGSVALWKDPKDPV